MFQQNVELLKPNWFHTYYSTEKYQSAETQSKKVGSNPRPPTYLEAIENYALCPLANFNLSKMRI